MGIGKIINYLKAGKRCYDIVTKHIPPRLADGILTVNEMADIITEICDVFDIKAEIKIPKKFTDTYFDIVEYDTMKSH